MFFVSGLELWCGVFVGMINGDDQVFMLWVIYEGVVFQYCCYGENVVSYVVLYRLQKIWLVGGVLKSVVWIQIFVDVSGLLVEVLEGEEIGVFGVVMCVVVVMGYYLDFVFVVQVMCWVEWEVMLCLYLCGFYDE